MTYIRAVIVADGDVDPDSLRAALAVADGETLLAIGADGGARHLAAAGRQPDLICGDADSLSAEELLRFVLSPLYLELRRSLGLEGGA